MEANQPQPLEIDAQAMVNELGQQLAQQAVTIAALRIENRQLQGMLLAASQGEAAPAGEVGAGYS